MNKNTKLVNESLFSGKSDSDNSSVYNTNESDWFPKSDDVGIQYLAKVGVKKNNSGLKPEVFNLLADMAGEIIALKIGKKYI